MSDQIIEVGFTVNLPKGKVVATPFIRMDRTDQSTAFGFDPETKRASWTYGRWRIGVDIFLCADEAIAAAEAARIKRIASLRKQLDKLESMTIRVAQGDKHAQK